ncbi:MAG: C1 family peptidase [Dehalococcoidia bacterium]
MKKLLAILILCVVLAPSLEGSTGAAHSRTYPIMRPDRETLEKWIEDYNTAPLAQVETKSWEAASLGGSQDLLGHLEYIPGQRDQGMCENCWVWAGTGIMEIALDVQEGIEDRLSIQYLNSNYNNGSGPGWACCGGGLSVFVNFYDDAGIAIPWSNNNAGWQDYFQQCGDYSTGVPADTISTTPNYPISSIDEQVIPTLPIHGVTSQATAIANIKYVLDQGKGVWFAFYLPDDPAWGHFFDFWDSENESVAYEIDRFNGDTYNLTEGGGHAVLCVGYDDEDPNNSYWVMLNSWGTAYGRRPNGLFRINMDMAYDCHYLAGLLNIPSFEWQTLDVDFAPISIVTPNVTTTATTFVGETTATLNGVIDNDGGQACRYRFGYSSTPGGPYTYTSWSMDTKTSGQSFTKTVSGLAKGTKYYFIAEAENSAGIGGGSELSFLTKPDPPNSFVTGAAGIGQINLLWIRGEGAQKTKIQRKEGGYPTYKDDGTQVYFGEGTSISDTGLTPGNTYYYRAWSYVQGSEQWSDSYAQTLGTTGTGLNNPPHLPGNPSPANDAAGVSINADLSWTGGDPDAGDAVIYGVYFGTTETPPLKQTIGPYPAIQSSITYDPGMLAHDMTYHWQIVAKDSHGVTREGPVWEFTTGPEPTVTWNLPWGLDADPAAVNIWTYRAGGVAVTLTDVEGSMPSELLIWYYGGPIDGWQFYKNGWGASNTLETLIADKGYIGIVPTASVWEIPQG